MLGFHLWLRGQGRRFYLDGMGERGLITVPRVGFFHLPLLSKDHALRHHPNQLLLGSWYDRLVSTLK